MVVVVDLASTSVALGAAMLLTPASILKSCFELVGPNLECPVLVASQAGTAYLITQM